MRILAIRGCNLASLVGEFAIDLDEPPFDHTGLFAITGPTGSGKSTVLDALCLALFDRTPRMGSVGGVQIGRAEVPDELKLRANDVRSVMSRSEGSAWAEVDFVGQDGESYRTRWSVRRAREHPSGRIQPQTVELRALSSGIRLGDKKTATLELIEQKLGLSYSQFCRSVLLAQGHFAAFLAANIDQRADLLERMTGTSIYTRLSIGAYQRAKASASTLEQLTLDHQELLGSLLPEEERRALALKLTSIADNIASLDKRSEQARIARQWHEELERRRQARELADRQLVIAEQAQASAGERQRVLEKTQLAQQIRDPLATLDRLRSELSQLVAEVDSIASGLTGWIEQKTGLTGKLVNLESELQQCRDQLIELRPIFSKARELDLKVANQQETLRPLQKQLRDDTERQSGFARQIQQFTAELSQTAIQLEEIQLFFETHPGAAARRERAEEWRGRLQRYRTLSASLESLKSALELNRTKRGPLEQRLLRLDESITVWQTQVDEQRQQLAELPAHDQSGLAVLQQQWNKLSDTAARLIQQRQIASHQEQLQVRRQQLTEQRVTLRQQLSDQSSALLQIQSSREELCSSLELSREQLERTRSVDSLLAHRAELGPGKPCPLCGSTEHPYHTGSPLDGLLSEQKEQLALQEKGRDELDRQLREQNRTLTETRLTIAHHDEQLAALDQELLRISQAWRESFPDSEAVPAQNPGGFLQTSTDRLAALEEQRVRIQQQQSQILEQHRQRTELQEALQGLRNQLSEAQKQRGSTSQELAEIELVIRTAEAELESSRATIDEICSDLSLLFADLPDWRDRAASDFDGFRESLRLESLEVERLQRAQSAIDKRRSEIQPLLQLANAQHSASTAQLEIQLKTTARAEAELQQSLELRAGLLEGRPVDAVESAITDAIEGLERELKAQRSKVAEVEREVAVAQTRSSDAGSRLSALRAAVEASEASINGHLRESELDIETVRQLLVPGAEWIDEEKRALKGLEQQLIQHRSVAEERRRQERQHREHDPPQLTPDDAERQLTEIELQANRAREELYQLRHRKERDDERRAGLATLAPAVAEQRQRSELWQALSTVIGSADGKKFRVFAQSLTLDRLLQEANRYLIELAPRYRLQRVPTSHLSLQVIDREMGDEVRSTNSLSGGETFLVSLALALGLSALSARSIPVGSLFIDEGFGSLDPETLDVALSALDSLQAAGRQIGLISHVEGMAERVGVQVRVTPRGNGLSTLSIDGPAPIAEPVAEQTLDEELGPVVAGGGAP